MTHDERRIWMKLSRGIEEKLSADKPLGRDQLESYWRLRHVDPLIQMRWEAETKVESCSDGYGIGTIIFPNGNQLRFEGVRLCR